MTFAKPTDTNGAQIHTRYLVGADGSRLPWTLHDLAADLDCYLFPGEPDPAGPRACQRRLPVSSFYSASDCSGTALRADHGAPPPRGAGDRITTVYEPFGGGCRVATERLDAYDFYDVGTDWGAIVAAPPALFTRTAPTGAPAEPILWRGADGSTFWLGDVATYGLPGTNGTAALIPAIAPVPLGRTTSMLADGGSPYSGGQPCKNVYDLFDPPPPGTAAQGQLVGYDGAPWTLDGVPPPVTYYWNGAVLDSECFEMSAVADRIVYRLHACSIDAFAAATTLTIGGSRLIRSTAGYGKTAVAVPSLGGFPSVEDVSFGVTCSPRVATDGVLRCMPDGPLAYYYADAACTQPLAASFTKVGAFIGHYENGLYSAHRIASSTLPTQLFRLDEGACSPVTLPAGSAFSTLTDAIAPDAFVEVSFAE